MAERAGTVIRVSVGPGEVRVAALRDDRLVDYAVWRPGAPDGVGDLHRGRITARLPALAGSFVAIAGADGFLPDSDAGSAGEGATIGVRVTRAAQGGKGPRLSARLDAAEAALVGAGQVGLVRRGPDAVERLAALHPGATVLVDDAGLLATLRPVLGPLLSLARPGFDDAIEAEIEQLGSPRASLPGGAAMSVHTTPALTAIDIDLAARSGARSSKTASHAAANLAMLPELGRQIRLRNLAGAILVDFAGLSPRRREAFGPALAATLADDPLRPRFLGFSHLGLAEILRPRVHPPLKALLAGPHAAGLAALRRAAAEQAARPDRVATLRVAPAVADALLADNHAIADFQRMTGRKPALIADHALAPTAWRIEL